MTQMMCNTSFSAMKNKDHLELKRGFLPPLPSPELSSPDTLFHVLVPFQTVFCLSSSSLFLWEYNALSLRNCLSTSLTR